MLDGWNIISNGQSNRSAKNQFIKLMKKLDFQEKVQKIFLNENLKGNEYLRFNALQRPEDFLDYMYNLSHQYSEITILEEHYQKDDWLINYNNLQKLLDLWFGKKSNLDTDLLKFHKTKKILLSLIPVTDSDNSLKSIEQYLEDKENIKNALYEYNEKKMIHADSPFMQIISQLDPIIKNIENYIDLIHTEHFHTTQKNILMDALMDKLQLDALHESIKMLLDQAKIYQSAYHDFNIPEAGKYYQDIWDQIKDM